MTACSNNHSKRVSAVLAASLVGALSVGAPVVALAAGEGNSGVSMLAAGDAFADATFKWSVDADRFGDYTVEAGTPFLLESVTDPFGSPVSMSDLTVVYFKSDNTGITTKAPTAAGDYKAVVFDAAFEVDTASDSYANLTRKYDYVEQDFKVAAKSLAGAFAYEGDDTTDTSFKYLGRQLEVNFADADGNELKSGSDYTIINGSASITNAGTYVLTLKGAGDYSGTANVTVKVDKIDLSKDVITVDPVKLNDGTYAAGEKTTGIKVNGEAVEDGTLVATVKSGVKEGDQAIADPANYRGNVTAKLNLEVTNNSGDAGSVTGGPALVESSVVDELASFDYDGKPVTDASKITLISSKGEKLDTSLVSAYLASSDKDVPVDVTVTKDGKAVTDYSQPGTYKVTATVPVPGDLAYAGTVTFEVTVQSRQLPAAPKYFVSVDGKAFASGDKVEYDGENVAPTVLVKSGSTTLVEGEDYTVTYKKDGKAVDSIVEPGEYEATIDYLGATVVNHGVATAVSNDTFTVEVTKATIKSAKADKQVFDLVDGKAVTPVFTAYTKKDCKGLSVTIDPAKVGVTYYEAALDRDGKPYLGADGKYVVEYNAGNPVTVAASDLNEEGWYVATLNVPADDEHITGQLERCVAFQVSEFAAFEDVDASAWYADVVYKANDLNYMNGIGGTKLFMPAANITRAQMACTLFNMAGQQSVNDKTNWPTRFDDVVSDTWYSQAISWASEAGVMGGYTGTDSFGTNDPTTREQAAAILYNYAKAQGKDVSVKDADAALAKFDDASEVSAWAKTAVAWAVENGVLGNGGYIGAKDTITRAEMAAMAVNFQPEALK